jgi:hypothetical protein
MIARRHCFRRWAPEIAQRDLTTRPLAGLIDPDQFWVLAWRAALELTQNGIVKPHRSHYKLGSR